MAPDLPFGVGASRAEITPSLDVGILMSSVERLWAPFQGVRTPLYARTVVMEAGGRRVALSSLELLGLSDLTVSGYPAFKARICAASGGVVAPKDLILTSTHTHAAPSSLGLTDLYQTLQFRVWLDEVVEKIGQSIQRAAEAAVPCRLAVASEEVDGLAVYRRIKTADGIVLSHPPPPPDVVIARDGPVDNTVRLAAFLAADDQPVALLVNATCHPVYEMCIPNISSDYPGAMSATLESLLPGATALFLNGAAGNINPPTVSSGAEEAIRHGQRLAGVVEALLSDLRPVDGFDIRTGRRQLELPARTLSGMPDACSLRVELACMRVGDAGFLFIPGEPFVETGLAVHAASPCKSTFVAGYAEDWIGYIPTDRALVEGGYETGPGAWSRVGRGAEEMVRLAGLDLLQTLCTESK